MQKFPKELTLAETQKIAEVIKFDFYCDFSFHILHSIWQSGKIEVTEETYKGICDNLISPELDRPIVDEIFGAPAPVCPYKPGELIVVNWYDYDKDNTPHNWVLRYATGNMDNDGRVGVYVKQHNWSGSVAVWVKDHRSLKDIHTVL